MAGVDDRRYDVKDILDRATYGWIAAPAKPALIVKDRDHPLSAYIGRQAQSIANGVFYIKDMSFERNKLSDKYETRVWSFNCIIISESFVLLQGLFDQARETFDRYTNKTANTPFSTSTLGTSTTYIYAGIEAGDLDERPNRYALDCKVYLKEQFVSVVVA